MRTKVISVVAAVAVMAIGVTVSNASFRSEASMQVKLAKPGAPAKVHIVIDNSDSVNVPVHISSVVTTSKVAKFNGKAIPQCTTKIPTNADGDNTAAALNPACPSGSKVGTGTFVANTGVPGQPIPFNDVGVINGTLNLYNYKTQGGEQAAMLLEIMSDTPVPDAHQYARMGVSNSGVITSVLPNTADLPEKVSNLLRVNPPTDMSYRTTSMAHVDLTIKSPTPKKGKKPFFTLKNTKNLDFSIVLNRD
ncbi:MAG: hypothetical protein HY827_10655 [Actinobacteria bacterium]|nr:hypothetical protein [Actinomycetota bacterium]